MGTGRATRGGHLASDSLPVRVAGEQGVSTSGSQEKPPECDLPLSSTALDVDLNSSQVGKRCKERGLEVGAGGSRGLRGEVASFCVFSSPAGSPECEVDK